MPANGPKVVGATMKSGQNVSYNQHGRSNQPISSTPHPSKSNSSSSWKTVDMGKY